jgi:epoxyqueuosine reductase
VDPTSLTAQLRALAASEGLPIVGVAPATEVVSHRAFVEWLEAGYAGGMSWLRRDAAPRRDPRLLLESARSVLVAALSHAHPDGAPDGTRIPPERLAAGPRGTIARYARGGDYHHVLREKLRKTGNAFEAALGRPLGRLVCVDTAPLLERALAHAAGIGFIAKSGMLIAPGAGSYLSLGALILDVELTPGAPMSPRCGACTSCLDACPTGAFVAPGVVDARRCISYLTIENRGAIEPSLRRAVGTRIFGCDVCQEVCPFNAGGDRVGDAELAPRPGYSAPQLLPLLRIGAAQFRKWQRRSALRRIHRNELLRNVAVAIGNSGGAESIDALGESLAEPSALVRAHAVWALREIAAREPSTRARVEAMLSALAASEADASVVAELRRTCADGAD